MKKLYYIIFFALLLVMAGCGVKVPEKNVTDMPGVPSITPGYTGLVLPPNIAPMNFEIDMPGETGTSLLSKAMPALLSSPRAKW